MKALWLVLMLKVHTAAFKETQIIGFNASAGGGREEDAESVRKECLVATPEGRRRKENKKNVRDVNKRHKEQWSNPYIY